MCLVLGKYIKMICRRAQGWRLGKLLKVWMFFFYLIITTYPLTWKEQQRRHNSWRGRNVAVDNKILSWGWKRSWLFFFGSLHFYEEAASLDLTFVMWIFLIVFVLLLWRYWFLQWKWEIRIFLCFPQHVFCSVHD